MDYEHNKVDACVLALMCLTMFGDHGATRAWKGFDWDVLDRLHEKGWICDPKSKTKSVLLTDQGETEAKAFFEKFLGGSLFG